LDQAKILWDSPVFLFPQVGRFGISFNQAFLIPFLVAALSSALKTMGDLTTCQKINDSDWKRIEMKSISKGILACATGNLTSGLLGALGQSVSSSNIGLAIATGATSRAIGYAAGGILILLAFLPKLAAVFVIMPTPVMGAALVFAVCFMIMAGIQILMSRMIDARKTFVVGLSIIFGLSFDSLPGLYAGFDPTVRPLVSSSLAVATICAVVLNMLFRIGISKTVSLELEPGVDTSEKIFSFMEKQGGAWGARREVIFNAIATINELLDAAEALNLMGKKIQVTVQFDEFNLDVRALYEGNAFEIPASLPCVTSLQDALDMSLKLAAYTMGRYADKISFSTKEEMTELHMHFDH
jgi:xanthine permease XanP